MGGNAVCQHHSGGINHPQSGGSPIPQKSRAMPGLLPFKKLQFQQASGLIDPQSGGSPIPQKPRAMPGLLPFKNSIFSKLQG